MIPRDRAAQLQYLASLLTADGWEEVDLGLDGPETTRALDGISFRLISSPGRRILLTANWRKSGASTSIVRLDPADPRAALWHAEAVNLPVNILMAAARAAVSEPPGPGPIARLRSAGWLRQPIAETGHGVRVLIFHDPAGGRWASAQYLYPRERMVRGPWLIARNEIETTGGLRAYAHTASSAPGGVIAALALTDGTA